MIVFELICAKRHRFEGWFASGEEFGAQRKRRLISCPLCGSDSVEKLPTARIGKSESAQPDGQGKRPTKSPPAETCVSLNELVNYVLVNTEDVGARFAVEARRIHKEEAPQRGIRGTATREEAKDLVEEGVPIMALPIPPKGEWH